MAEKFFPFDDGPGADSYEDRWSQMARLWRPDGIVQDGGGELECTANGSGMQVFADVGRAWFRGFFYENTASLALDIDAADSQPRIDRVVVRLDTLGNTIHLQVNRGVAGTEPVEAGMATGPVLWDLPIAAVVVDADAVTVEADKVTDQRLFTDTIVRRIQFRPGNDALDVFPDDGAQVFEVSGSHAGTTEVGTGRLNVFWPFGTFPNSKVLTVVPSNGDANVWVGSIGIAAVDPDVGFTVIATNLDGTPAGDTDIRVNYLATGY